MQDRLAASQQTHTLPTLVRIQFLLNNNRGCPWWDTEEEEENEMD